MLPVAGDPFRRHRDRGFAADCVDARPGGATRADGHSSRGAQQHAELCRAVAHHVRGDAGGLSACCIFPRNDWRGPTLSAGWRAFPSRSSLSTRRIASRNGVTNSGPNIACSTGCASNSRIHPVAAFTASATQRVRHDILAQLRLRQPEKVILSFDRPNLRYLIREVDARTQETLLLRALHGARGFQRDRAMRRPFCVWKQTVDFLNETRHSPRSAITARWTA